MRIRIMHFYKPTQQEHDIYFSATAKNKTLLIVVPWPKFQIKRFSLLKCVILFLLLSAFIFVTGCVSTRIKPVTREVLPKYDNTPERIILNLTETPATSQAVTWRTASIIPNPVAQISKATGSTSFRSKPVTQNALSESIVLDNNTRVCQHSVIFENLAPKTLYAYRVGEKDHWSEWNQFKTASQTFEPFSFIYFGDPQEEVKSICSRTFRAACKEAAGAAFWLFVGDLVDNGDNDNEWEELFDAFGWIPRTTPMILVPGNHEYPDKRFIRNDKFHIFSLWRPQFTLPENGPDGLEETAYFIDYQGVRFVMLNGNERLKEQVEWLEKILSNNPQKWTIAAIHQPIYSTGRKRKDSHRQELFVPIFDRFSVDLVIQGHDHTYARSKKLIKNQPSTIPHRGTVYVTSVSGPKFYPVNHRYDRLMETIGTEIQLFQVIHLEEQILKYEAFDSTGKLYDRFELQK